MQYGQCDTGANSSTIFCATQHAQPGRLYVDTGLPITCMGIVVRLEYCYTVVSVGPGRSSQSFISLVVLRRDEQTQAYHIVNVSDFTVENVARSSESNEEYPTFCDFIDSDSHGLFVHQGDLFGFVCGERVRILFTSVHQDQMGCSNTLRVYNISSRQTNSYGDTASTLLRVGSIQADQFELVNQSITPMLRVIMSK